MAAGDVFFFDQYCVDVQEALHDQEAGTFKLGLIIQTTNAPAIDMLDPRWGNAGTTDLSADEVTPGGNYSTGGPTLANPTVTLSGGAGVFDADDVSITQHASNPTNARYGIIYNTAAGNRALGWIDLGSDRDLSAGDFTITWNASGISSLDQA